MAPDILGADEFEQDFDTILSLMETKSWRGSHARKNFIAITNNIKKSKINKSEVLKLLTYLDELDRRRNTNWRELFPWLIKYEDLCGIQK